MYASIEIEQNVISLLLIAPGLWKVAANEYDITADSFTYEAHRRFFSEGMAQIEQGLSEPDFFKLVQPKDIKYFLELQDRSVLPSQHAVPFLTLKKLEYARMAREGMQEMLTEIEAIGNVPEIEPIVTRLDELKDGMSQFAMSGKVATLADAQREAEEYIRNGLEILPLFGAGTMGDKAFSLHSGETMVLSGTTGTGKTALAAQWALTMAIAGKRVLYVCTESTAREIYLRFCATLCGLPHYHAASPSGLGAVFRTCAKRMYPMFENKLFLLCLTRTKPTTSDIERKIQMIEKQHGKVDAMFIDYIQDIGYPASMGRMNDLQKIEAVIDRIHDTCLFHGIAGIYLSQLNRTGEKDQAPGNEQIKNASKIAEKAHIVSFLWRKRVGIDPNDETPRNALGDKEGKESCSRFYSTKCRNTSFFNLKLEWDETKYVVKNDFKSYYPIYNTMCNLLPELAQPGYVFYDELYTPEMARNEWQNAPQGYGQQQAQHAPMFGEPMGSY